MRSSKKLSMEELRKCECGVLDYVDSICRENKITYYLAFGTLIGAVRHKGFIPWDDDIDIVMLRSEYNRFEHIVLEKKENKANAEGRRYRLISLKSNAKYIIPYPKVYDTWTLLERKNYRGCPPMGAYVDIFILDYLPNNAIAVKYNNWLLMKLTVLWEISAKNKGGGRNIISKSLQKVIRIIPPRKYAILMDKLARRFNSRNHSNIVNIMHYWLIPKLAIDESEYGIPKLLEFEGKLYPVPSNFDLQLRMTYGDYMVLPPPEQRVPKHPNDTYWV